MSNQNSQNNDSTMGMDFVENRFETLVETLGKTRVLELILKGQQWETAMTKRAQYQKERLSDPTVGPQLKAQRAEYQRKRNQEIKMALEFVRQQR
jgi:uncharacterized beta-barrel protein YwiB (DUF1934 family)